MNRAIKTRVLTSAILNITYYIPEFVEKKIANRQQYNFPLTLINEIRFECGSTEHFEVGL